MKHFILIFLLTISVGNVCTYAQEKGGKEMEREVKTSGKYYYGEGLDSDLNVAKKNASDDLKLMILERAMESNAKLSSVDYKGFESNMSTLIFELEGRVKVLVFLPKSDIALESAGEQKVFVIRNTDSGVELVPQGTNTSKSVAQAEPQPVETPNVITIGSSKKTSPAASSSEQSQPAATPITVGATPPARVVSNPNNVASYGNSSQENKTSDPIINKLLAVKSYEEARQILNANKSNGKLMYGQLATLSNPQNCYFLVLQDRVIVDILDKSSGLERKSLVTGKTVNYKSVQGIVLWVCIL